MVGPLRLQIDNSPAICLVPMMLLVYFLCICIYTSAPDRTARRSVVSCLLTLVFGTAGLFGGSFAVLVWRASRLPEFLTEWAIGFGAFAVYFSAFVFLMRFHAAVALSFGNRWLGSECHVFLFVPIFVVIGNVCIERSRFAPPSPHRRTSGMARMLCNFAVFVWYAMIVLRTFRTIDRGPVTGSIDAELDDADDSDPDRP